MIAEITHYLNDKTKAAFRPTTSLTKKMILERLSEGFTTADYKKGINIKAPNCSTILTGASFSDRKHYLEPNLNPISTRDLLEVNPTREILAWWMKYELRVMAGT